jgi:hypothetical protein
MVDRGAAAGVGFLARGLIAAEGGIELSQPVGLGRDDTNVALAIDARSWRVGFSMRDAGGAKIDDVCSKERR